MLTVEWDIYKDNKDKKKENYNEYFLNFLK